MTPFRGIGFPYADALSVTNGPSPVSYGRIRGRQLNTQHRKRYSVSGVGQDAGEAGRATNGGETWSNAGRQLHRNGIGVWREGTDPAGKGHRYGGPCALWQERGGGRIGGRCYGLSVKGGGESQTEL